MARHCALQSDTNSYFTAHSASTLCCLGKESHGVCASAHVNMVLGLASTNHKLTIRQIHLDLSMLHVPQLARGSLNRLCPGSSDARLLR
jgi:hypothetical protein